MADAFLSTGSGGLRTSRSHYVDMPRDSLFADARWRAVDEERMRRLEAEEEVRSCMERCSVFASQCGNLFCVGRMPVLTRVLVLWFWVLVLAAVLALLTVTVALGPVSYSPAPRDSLLLTSRLSSFFCGAVALQGADAAHSAFTAYLLDASPTVSKSPQPTYHVQRLFVLEQNRKEYWKFHFLEGSKATAKVCLSSASEDASTIVYSIQGEGNFRAWQSNPECGGCYVSRVVLSACSDLGQGVAINATSEDDYYVAVFSAGDYAHVSVDISVSRTVFDTSLAMRNCDQHTPDCRFPLNFGFTQYVVFVAAENWAQEGQLTSACRPRVWTMVDIFLLGTVVLGLTLSLLICRCARDPRTAEMQIVQGRRGWWSYRRLGRGSLPSERSPLLGSTVPSRAAPPPRYDDVISREERASPPGPPPPYSDSESGATAASTPPATEQGRRDQHSNAEDDPHPTAGMGEDSEGGP